MMNNLEKIGRKENVFTLKHAEKREPHLEEAVVRQEEEGNGSVR